jgi:hypothetical protein
MWEQISGGRGIGRTGRGRATTLTIIAPFSCLSLVLFSYSIGDIIRKINIYIYIYKILKYVIIGPLYIIIYRVKVFNFGVAKVSATTEITEFHEIRLKFR